MICNFQNNEILLLKIKKKTNIFSIYTLFLVMDFWDQVDVVKQRF